MLYFTLVISKLEYASVVWNSITTTDANKLERIQQKFAALCYNRLLSHVHYSYAKSLEYLKLHTLCKRVISLIHCSLSKFTVVWNTALPSWKLSVFEFLLGISETFLRSVSALQLLIVLLLDAHQLLMLSAGTLMYLKQKLFPLVIFYNYCGAFHILDINSIPYKFILKRKVRFMRSPVCLSVCPPLITFEPIGRFLWNSVGRSWSYHWRWLRRHTY
jgi:hypothetical protein